MPIYNGSNKVKPSGITKVYVGSNLVWQKSVDPTSSEYWGTGSKSGEWTQEWIDAIQNLTNTQLASLVGKERTVMVNGLAHKVRVIDYNHDYKVINNTPRKVFPTSGTSTARVINDCTNTNLKFNTDWPTITIIGADGEATIKPTSGQTLSNFEDYIFLCDNCHIEKGDWSTSLGKIWIFDDSTSSDKTINVYKKEYVAKLTFEFANLYSTSYSTAGTTKWNSYLSNVNFSSSTLNTYLKNTVLGLLPTILQNNIKEVTKLFNKSVDSGSTYIATNYNTKLFVLAEDEYFEGSGTYTVPDIGTIYNYYVGKSLDYRKKYPVGSSNAKSYWFRSIRTGGKLAEYLDVIFGIKGVNTNGADYGVAPCFCI